MIESVIKYVILYLYLIFKINKKWNEIYIICGNYLRWKLYYISIYVIKKYKNFLYLIVFMFKIFKFYK